MRALIWALAMAVAAPAVAAPSDDLKKVIDEHWTWAMKWDPVYATMIGVRDHDMELGDFTLAGADRKAAEAGALLKRLEAIPDAGLTPFERTNRDILKRMLSEQIEANGFGQRMIMFSNRDGMHQLVSRLGEFLPMRSKRDYESYLARIAQWPAANDEIIAISARAAKEGYTQPCEAMDGFEKSISGVIATDAEKSSFYAPFLNPRPNDVTEAEWSAMQTQAKALITDKLNPAYVKFGDFYAKTYLPACAKKVAIAAQPKGAAYYAFRVRQMTTTTLTPDAIHALGLSEVKRIRAEMEEVAKKAGAASREAFIQELRTNPKYYAKTPEELMEANSRVAKIIDGKMPGLFGRLPRLPYGLREIPAATAEGTTTAYYMPGSPEGGMSGTYYVNTSKLDQRPLWEVPALTVHEAVPGHHHQIALQQELDLPEYRKHLAFFTAFTEGWGLYSERLGIEMGLYDTPERDMGRLSYEMWRACRLVVDTGLHAKGWTKAQAIAYMTDNSALTAANIEAEVNRYIANPGQALAYKLGELKIRELRTKAEAELGKKFDLRHFHDAVLDQGSVPLDVLDAQVNAWIAAEKAKG